MYQEQKILGVAKLTYEELLTVLTEVQGVLNSRPQTYVYSDEVEEPLTPSHFMTVRRLLLSHFWNSRQKEYLTELHQFHQYAVNDKSKQKESNVKKEMW